MKEALFKVGDQVEHIDRPGKPLRIEGVKQGTDAAISYICTWKNGADLLNGEFAQSNLKPMPPPRSYGPKKITGMG